MKNNNRLCIDFYSFNRNYLIFLFLFPITFIAQEKLNWRYFEKFNQNQKQIIINNWKQYFPLDIYSKLDEEINCFPIKLDSYGSIYPLGDILSDEVDFNKYHRSSADLLAYSLLDIFNSNRSTLENKIKSSNKLTSQQKSFYLNCFNDPKDMYNDSVFYTKWDSYHLEMITNSLNEKLKTNKFKSVFFFIHGYNVPYSLANVQLIALKNTLRDSLKIDTDKVLFVPVFWSSNDLKKCKIESYNDFDITNYTGLFNGGAANGLLFLYYSNRAYYSSITLRKILNSIENRNIDIVLFSHSLGATILTSALINTTSKLDSKIKFTLGKNEDGTSYLVNSQSIKEADYLAWDIINSLVKEKIPQGKMKSFMSAPAIPGKNTFINIDDLLFKDKSIYSTINIYDEMLTKSIANIRIVNESNMSATSLGCDSIEANQVKQIIEGKKQLNSKFIYETVSDNDDHDILTYLNQKDTEIFY